MTTVAPTKTGSLTIAGSGIASVGQLTLETLSHIQQADKVFYIVCDPATEAFIQANAKAPTSDLSVYYDTDKSRYDSYVQMSEVMLQEVRGGKDVLGVFYGHPGVFVSPSHRALAIARSEGYEAKMLPGVSAEDYMFADLEFDPAVQGCATFEATELLLRDIPLNPTMNNIIWQVGAVGVGNMVFDNAKFHLLVDRLEKDFGPEHKVVHYIGAVLPQSATVMDTFTVAELRKDDVVKQFNPSSTLFVPPLHTPVHSAEMAARLCATPSATLDRQQRFPGLRWANDGASSTPAYGPREKAAVAQLAEHVVPEDHKVLIASAAMKKLAAELGYDAGLQAKYKADPKAFADAVDGLTDLEKTALGSGQHGAIYHAMKGLSGTELTEEQLVGPMPNSCLVIVVIVV